jgi:hypothetical protein
MVGVGFIVVLAKGGLVLLLIFVSKGRVKVSLDFKGVIELSKSH